MLSRLLRAGCATYLVLRWGIDPARLPAADVYGPGFETRAEPAVHRPRVRLRRSRRRVQSPENLDEEEAREALERIRQGVRRADPELVAYGEDDLEELNRFLTARRR